MDAPQGERPRRIELLVPMRTLLLVVAAAAVVAAFKAIGSTFLWVFLGIFAALVFEFPVRLVMRKTHMSRGLAATVTVLGTAVGIAALALVFLVKMVGSVRDYLQDLPDTIQQLRDSGELDWLGDSGSGENVQNGAEKVAQWVP